MNSSRSRHDSEEYRKRRREGKTMTPQGGARRDGEAEERRKHDKARREERDRRRQDEKEEKMNRREREDIARQAFGREVVGG